MTKTNFQEPRMQFNQALDKFEPILPLRKTRKKLEIKINWEWIITMTIIFIALSIFLWIKIKFF
jgi:hypothetical protein